MKKYNLHHWMALLFFTVLTNACSKKITNASVITDDKVIDTPSDSLYIPPAFIMVPDDKAKTNKEDELYYDDAYGYRYWRYSDGKYYLDQKYKPLPAKKKAAIVAKFTKASS